MEVRRCPQARRQPRRKQHVVDAKAVAGAAVVPGELANVRMERAPGVSPARGDHPDHVKVLSLVPTPPLPQAPTPRLGPDEWALPGARAHDPVAPACEARLATRPMWAACPRRVRARGGR